jgi:hypothetical protein
LLALSDSATGARFGLRPASLLNAAGAFVAPTDAGLAAGAAAMVDSAIPGVRRVDFAKQPAEAYPLTQVTYAVTAPSALSQAEGRDYASFLRFAVGPGQSPGSKPGNLPAGYLPLPQPLADQAVAAALVVETSAGVPVAPPTAAEAAPLADESFEPSAADEGPAFGSDFGADVVGEPPFVDSATVGAQSEFTPTSLAAASVQSSPTPGDPSGPARYGLLAAAALGGLAALAGPLLLRFSRR